jgi:hypothetical protein
VQTRTFSRKPAWASAHESLLSPRVNQAGPREREREEGGFPDFGNLGPNWASPLGHKHFGPNFGPLNLLTADIMLTSAIF